MKKSNLCTYDDICSNGVCHGTERVCGYDGDQCHDEGSCNPSSGSCEYPNLPDYTNCSDSDLCTTNDLCIAGVCTPGSPLVCQLPGVCQQNGTCNSQSGTCEYPSKPNGTSCTTDLCEISQCWVKFFFFLKNLI